MAEGGQERTEEATPKRRQEARKKGQVVRSADLPPAAGLLVAVLALRVAGPMIWAQLQGMVQGDLAQIAQPDLAPQAAMGLLGQSLLAALLAIAPLVGALLLGGVITGLIQTGFVFSGQALKPKFDKLNPLHGMKRLFSPRTGFEMAKMALRLGIFIAVAATSVGQIGSDVLRLGATGMAAVPPLLGNAAFTLMLRLALAGGILAGLDYGFQRWQFNRNLKMTKQEIRDEMRQAEGDPQVKQRIRRLQRQRAKQRMMQDVPKSTVVIANPTHFAVALRYESGKMRAPVVLAKGRDLVAQQIKALAAQHGVPVVENPPLARALYAGVPLGREIPLHLY